MNRLKLWILVGVLFGMPSAVLAADVPGVGIVKGTITIDGKPATDAVVSIEDLSKEQIKMAINKPAKKKYRPARPKVYSHSRCDQGWGNRRFSEQRQVLA